MRATAAQDLTVLAIPGVSPAPQPMDLSASTAGHPALSSVYLVAAVALPLMLVTLVGLRALSAPARWRGWDGSGIEGWGRRLPYELFVLAPPILATAGTEWLAIAALVAGDNRSSESNRLMIASVILVVTMGTSALRLLRGQRFHHPHDPPPALPR